MLWLCLAGGLMLSGLSGRTEAVALAPSVNNGSFENDSAGNGKTSLSNWSVTAGSVDVLNGSSIPSGAATGDKFLDLANGTIEQTISGFSTSQTYLLRIDYRGNPSDGALKDAKVIINGQEMRQGLFGGDLPGIHSKEENDWVVCNGFQFQPNSSTVTIKIDSEESGSNGLLIDNVRILDGGHIQPPEHNFNSLSVDGDGWRPLVNGSFESGIATHSSNPENTGPDDNNPHLCGNSLPGWRVTRENTDRINGWSNTPDGSKVIDVGGHGPGSIAQTITGLLPNSTYQLEFYAARHRFWGTNTMMTEVWANGQKKLTFSRTRSQTADAGYIREVVNLTSNSNGKITFEIFSTNVDKGGNNVMDDFRIRALNGPTTTTPTETLVPTPIPTQTTVPTSTPTETLVPTPIPTQTSVPTSTPTETLVPTSIPTQTSAPTPTPTETLLPTPIPTQTSVPTSTPTEPFNPSPTPIPSRTPTLTSTSTPSSSQTPSPSSTPLPTATRPGSVANLDHLAFLPSIMNLAESK